MDNIYSAFHYLQKCIKEALKAKTYAEEAKNAAVLAKGTTVTYWG